jgi:hypothetical protein
MAFSQFKSLGEAAQRLGFVAKTQAFMPDSLMTLLSDSLRERITIVLEESLHRVSEAARCDMLIAPMLYEAWLQHRSVFKLWSHAPLEYNEELSGTPDYLIARQSPFGTEAVGLPILVAVEAKKDDFILGWGQCAAEMIAIQKLNGESSGEIFGIVTNGETWEFGKLNESTMIRHPLPYTISESAKLFGALTFVMEECYKQVQKQLDEDK